MSGNSALAVSVICWLRASVALAKLAPTDQPSFSEEVARLAYQFWEERGRPEGSSQQDWYRAEAELSVER